MANDNNAAQYYDKTFPSPIAPDSVKKDPKYGLAIARSIFHSDTFGYDNYFTTRNKIFDENTIFANGKQPFQTYLDLLGVDANQSFININYHPRPVAPKFRDILVNDIMNKIESVDCTGLSLEINKRKKRKKDDAAFRMDEQQFIESLQQESGFQFEHPNEFVPDSEEDLELWGQLNDKEREELLMEEGINFVMYNNDWDSIKREVVIDLVEKGLGCSRTYFDARNRIRCKRVPAKQLIYGGTNTLDFRKVPYMAHIEQMSIVDVRTMWPNIEEKRLYTLAYVNRNNYGNDNGLGDWQGGWIDSYNRPYDGYMVNVLFFEYRVTKYVDYVKGTDRNNNKTFDFKKGNLNNPNKRPYREPVPTIYQGAWLVGSEIMGQWGEMTNLIRSNEDVEDVKFSYSVYMLNNSGDMLPVSPIQTMKSSIINMDLAILRMQHVLATTPPNGIRVDIDAWVDIDLGKGIGDVDALKLTSIYRQTGDVYYSGKAIGGDNKGWHSPIEQQQNNIGDQITQQINVYNFELNCIRDYVGVNEVRDGSGVNPRIGLQVMQSQISASNTATGHIYDAWVSIKTNSAKSIAIMLWDTLKSASPNSMYMKMLGAKNADFIKHRTAVTNSSYLTKITMNMSQQDAMFLEQQVQASLAQGRLQLEDALVIRKHALTNIDFAIRYLSWVQKKRTKEASDLQMKQAQATQQQQAQLVMQQQQDKAKAQEDADVLELKKDQQKGAITHEQDIDKMITQCMVKSMDAESKPIPEYVLAVLAEREQQKLMAEQQQAKDEMMQQQMEQHMAEQQGQGQPQMQVA